MLLLTPLIAGISHKQCQWLALRVWWHALAFVTIKCRQATSHYQNQCCPSSMLPYALPGHNKLTFFLHDFKLICEREMSQDTLVVVTRTTILVPCLWFKSLQLIWRSDTRRWNLWAPDLQMSCRDLTAWRVTRNSSPSNGHQGDLPTVLYSIPALRSLVIFFLIAGRWAQRCRLPDNQRSRVWQRLPRTDKGECQLFLCYIHYFHIYQSPWFAGGLYQFLCRCCFYHRCWLQIEMFMRKLPNNFSYLFHLWQDWWSWSIDHLIRFLS